MTLGRHGWIDDRNFIEHPEHECLMTEGLHAVQRAITGDESHVCRCEVLEPEDK